MGAIEIDSVMKYPGLPIGNIFPAGKKWIHCLLLHFYNLLSVFTMEPLNNSSAAEQRVFFLIRTVLKMGNTESIPAFLELSTEEKSRTVSSCRINQRFPIAYYTLCASGMQGMEASGYAVQK